MEFDLKKSLLDQLEKQGYGKLLDVQEKVIPHMLDKENIVVEAPTGSGKTLAYAIPILNMLNGDKNVKFIIMVPTKELGSQITNEFKKFTDKVLFLPDQVGKERQIENLKKKRPEILVGMPNRLFELIVYGKIKLNHLEYLVIDEGDKVLKRENQQYVEEILKSSLKTTPLAFFSATYRPVDQETISQYRKDIVYVDSKVIVGEVKHYYLMTDEKRKTENMFKVLKGLDAKKSIVFINRSVGVEGLVARFNQQTREVFKLHTDMEMQQRKNVLEKFRDSTYSILVTTDVFSRGLDIPDTDCVIHYDLPKTGNIYIHRSGRTGRGFRKGSVVSLVAEGEKQLFYDVRSMSRLHIGQIGLRKDGSIFFMTKGVNNSQK